MSITRHCDACGKELAEERSKRVEFCVIETGRAPYPVFLFSVDACSPQCAAIASRDKLEEHEKRVRIV